MLLRKIMCVLLSAVFMVATMGIAAAATPDTVQAKLALLEKDTYGVEQTGALLDRINKLEKDYNGSHRTGSMMARVDALYDEVYTNSSQPSVLAALNAVEWNIDHNVSMASVDKRVANMEMKISGQTNEGTYRRRIAQLASSSFGSETLPMEKVTVPANTLIKCELVTPVNSKNLKTGDKIRFRVVKDVTVNGALVFAKGEPGLGVVQKVRQARNFGRNGEVDIDFQQVKSIDGTEVDTFVGEESKKEMKNLAYAAGASIAGIAVLGPIGVVGGAFVKGKNVDLPAGTQFYVQTKQDGSLYGVMTTLAQ